MKLNEIATSKVTEQTPAQKLHVVKAQLPAVSLEFVYDEISKIFNDPDMSQNDTIKLKELSFDNGVISLHVETHAMETDFLTKIWKYGKSLKISGFKEPLIVNIGPKDTPNDVAEAVLGAISRAAEDEDDEHRDEDESEWDD